MLNTFSNDSPPSTRVFMRNSLILILTGVAACASSGAQSRTPSPREQFLRGVQPLQQQSRALADTTYDVVIRNGRVLDGEGNPWILADVAHPATAVREDRQDHGARQDGDRRAPAST